MFKPTKSRVSAIRFLGTMLRLQHLSAIPASEFVLGIAKNSGLFYVIAIKHSTLVLDPNNELTIYREAYFVDGLKDCTRGEKVPSERVKLDTRTLSYTFD